jgi:transcriptional regulator with XRE-family HTH domain
MGIILSKGEVELTTRPRRRKLYGHVMTDMVLRVGPKKIDRRKLPHAHGMGHPYQVAELRFIEDMPLYQAFHDILESLDYQKRKALARALGVSYQTIINWTKGKCGPTTTTFIQILQWDRDGRPTRKVTPGIDDDKPVFYLDKVNALRLADMLDKEQARWVESPGLQSRKVSQSIIEKWGIPATIKRPAYDLLSAERSYNPFDEGPFQSDEPQDSGWPYP